MIRNDRMLELAGLSTILSSSKLTLLYHQQVPDEVNRLNAAYELGRTIDYLKLALAGLRNKQLWDEDGKFALTKEYGEQDLAYRTICSVFDVSDQPTSQRELSGHISTLEAVRDGQRPATAQVQKTEKFLAAFNTAVRNNLSRHQLSCDGILT